MENTVPSEAVEMLTAAPSLLHVYRPTKVSPSGRLGQRAGGPQPPPDPGLVCKQGWEACVGSLSEELQKECFWEEIFLRALIHHHQTWACLRTTLLSQEWRKLAMDTLICLVPSFLHHLRGEPGMGRWCRNAGILSAPNQLAHTLTHQENLYLNEVTYLRWLWLLQTNSLCLTNEIQQRLDRLCFQCNHRSKLTHLS